MRPLISALATSFAMLVSFAEVSQGKPQASGPTSPLAARNDSTVVSLLEQSHDLNAQLPAVTRLSMLGRQAQMVWSLRANLGQAWADELFSLSLQLEGNERSFAQDTAMAILARLDPDRALGLLHSMDMKEPEGKGMLSPPPTQLTRQVFVTLVAREGVAALPAVEQEAERLGIEGHYPYAALGQAAMQSVSKDWGSNKEHAVEVVQAVFDREFARYSQDARRGYFDDLDFGNLLTAVAGGLPQESVRPALRLLAKNLLGTDTSEYQFQSEVYTKDGQKVRVDNAIDSAILGIGALINRVDPELAQELQATRPELKVGLEYAKDGRESSWMLAPLQGAPDPGAEARTDAIRLARVDSEAAIAKAEQMPNDANRASTLLDVARSIAGDKPERATELVAEAQEIDKQPSEEFQVSVISAQADVAASQGRKDELHELLRRGFDSANRMILKQQAQRLYSIAGLAPLVQIGMQNEPDLTLAFLQDLPASPLKAQVLLAAAAALNMRGRLPLRSRQD